MPLATMIMPLETTIITTATILIAYLIGALPFGYLIGKFNGLDIRQHGSGNIGATNVTRVVGKWWGRLCFLLDFVKGVVPVLVTGYLVRTDYLNDNAGVLQAFAAFATVAGHIWPIYLGFKGGKGISTAAGAIIALNAPTLISAGILWGIIFFASRYVSLASVLAAASLPFFCWFFKYFGIHDATKAEFVLLTLLAILTILKHTSNIKRLLKGTESRFVKKNEKTGS